MKKVVIPILILLLLWLSFKAFVSKNIPLFITLSILALIASYVAFSIDFDPTMGFILYIIPLLFHLGSLFKFIQRGFSLHWFGVFVFGGMYIIFLIIKGWFAMVKKGVIYIGYFYFLIQLILSVSLVYINNSFVQNGAIILFVHSLVFMFVLSKTKVKKEEEKG